MDASLFQKTGFHVVSVAAVVMVMQAINLHQSTRMVNDSTPMRISINTLAAPRALPSATDKPVPVENATLVEKIKENQGPAQGASEPVKQEAYQIKPVVDQQAKTAVTLSRDSDQRRPIAAKPEKASRALENKTPLSAKTRDVQQKTETTPQRQLQPVALQQQTPEAKPAREDKQHAPETVAENTASATDHNAGQQANTSLIGEARFRKQTPPRYPRRALELGQQGTVILHAKIMADGAPGTLKIAESSGHRLLDKAALSAVKKWQFEPTHEDGSAITSWVSVPVSFVIQ